MATDEATVYEFGEFRLEVRERRLFCDGHPVPLTTKVFETLRVLLERSGRLLTKDELMQCVWPDTVVEENNLNHNISVLRRALVLHVPVRESAPPQYTWSRGVNRRALLRSRLEERFVTNHHSILLRVRQQVRVTWPLAARRGLQGVVSEELFVRANSTSLSPALDSNEVFVGVGRKLTARSAMEIGYVNVYSRIGPNRHLRSHVVSATLTVAL